MLATLAISAALITVQSSQQFDLVCTGTMVSGAYGGRYAIPESSQPWTERFRIDLNNQLWCHDTCRSTLPILEANSGQLVLMRKTGNSGSTIRIDRTTGEALNLLETPSMGATIYVRSSGPCERAEFTPFPRLRTH